ncbi:MAG: ABC transporter substrate-binding protein [Candidatus Nomurabacteria bacterium]|jgi:peptide/nickel transport system substrate-binding protein|nr:ABC transporter substrate-binding protein [Candidatus Nomurabacteria bacterium]
MPKKKWGGLKPNLNSLRRQAIAIEKAAARHRQAFSKNRLRNFKKVRYSAVLWVSLMAVLILAVVLQGVIYNFNTTTWSGRAGGTYAEGIVGEITSFNPLYASSEDEKAISSLVYSSLFKTDSSNALRGDLATTWKISNDGLNYDIKLRDDVFWQNSDETVSADDVVFTFGLLQNPLAQSELYDSWRSITVSKIDNQTVRFRLKTALNSFPWALDIGILRRAELKDVEVGELREHLADHTATGSGPFKFHSTSLSSDNNQILFFVPNESYYTGAPAVESFHIETFADDEALVAGFNSGEINVATNISLTKAQALPAGEVHTTPLDSGVFAIFNTDNGVAASTKVRQALRLALDREQVRTAAAIDKRAPNNLETPLPRGIFSDVDDLSQPKTNVEKAEKTLSDSGWRFNKDLVRAKDGVAMKLNIVAVKGSDYVAVAENLATQWRRIGVQAEVTLAEPENFQQNFLLPRNYDVLVHQLQLGGDGDVYPYWHSSGARDSGLNFANYSSPVADLALARGRSQNGTALRASAYKTFAKTWLADAPAIALYQANLNYLVSDSAEIWNGQNLVDKSMRFRDAAEFTVNSEAVNKTP